MIQEQKNSFSLAMSGLLDQAEKTTVEKIDAYRVENARQIDDSIQRKTEDLYRETKDRLSDIEQTINREQKMQISAI
jgi:hypothetical protein